MSEGPPDRANDEKRRPQPLNFVRGGAVCQSGEEGGHLLQGSMSAAVCMPTMGSDTRSRWRKAGQAVSPPSRHSVQWAQHRGGVKKGKR